MVLHDEGWVKIRRVVMVGFKALCNTSEEGARES